MKSWYQDNVKKYDLLLSKKKSAFFFPPPDCKERGECSMFTEFCGEFIRYHSGPVLQEEALSGRFLTILCFIALHLFSITNSC